MHRRPHARHRRRERLRQERHGAQHPAASSTGPGRIEAGEIWLRGADGAPTPIDLADAAARTAPEMRAVRGKEIALDLPGADGVASASTTRSATRSSSRSALHTRRDARRRRATRAIELLRMVGVPRPERRVDEYPFQLSGGLRQRVMIAMALACDPRILIADEPTTALDVTTQAQVLDLLREHAASSAGSRVILITHDMGVIAEMADDVVVMYLGRAVEKGPVDDIFHAPKHPYTRALLRSIPSILAEPRTKLATHQRLDPASVRAAAGLPVPSALPGRHARACATSRRRPLLTELDEQREVSCFLYGARTQRMNDPRGRRPAASTSRSAAASCAASSVRCARSTASASTSARARRSRWSARAAAARPRCRAASCARCSRPPARSASRATAKRSTSRRCASAS